MAVHMGAREARNNFADIIGRVHFGDDVVIVERSGKPMVAARLLDAGRAQEYVLVTSPAIISEIRSTLNYPRIRRKYAITDEKVEQLTTLLQEAALVVPGTADADDSPDEAILACALDGKADLSASGDRRLPALDTFRGISIITVREFAERLEAGD